VVFTGRIRNITAQSNSAYQPLFAYTGQMWDATAGLDYYHARWYDASTGQFISQDPTTFAAGDPNLYRYVGNSPTNAMDPTGTDSTDSAATRCHPTPRGHLGNLDNMPFTA